MDQDITIEGGRFRQEELLALSDDTGPVKISRPVPVVERDMLRDRILLGFPGLAGQMSVLLEMQRIGGKGPARPQGAQPSDSASCSTGQSPPSGRR